MAILYDMVVNWFSLLLLNSDLTNTGNVHVLRITIAHDYDTVTVYTVFHWICASLHMCIFDHWSILSTHWCWLGHRRHSSDSCSLSHLVCFEPKSANKQGENVLLPHIQIRIYFFHFKFSHKAPYRPSSSCRFKNLKPILNWVNVCSPEHTSDTSTNYDSFLNWTFSSPNMVQTVQTLLHSQLAYNEMQALAWTCGRRAADSMIENVG